MAQKLTGFIGFPDGPMDMVRVPHLFFTDLLPKIDDLAELQLTLYLFHLLQPPQDAPRWIWGAQLRQDAALLQMLGRLSALHEPAVILEGALERAVARNTILVLHIRVQEVAEAREAFVLNSESGRQLQARIQAQDGQTDRDQAARAGTLPEVSRPFRLYQYNIGLLTPLVADQLRALEREYPVEWLCEAIEIAVGNNARSLRYIEAILRRWATEGRLHGTQPELISTTDEWASGHTPDDP